MSYGRGSYGRGSYGRIGVSARKRTRLGGSYQLNAPSLGTSRLDGLYNLAVSTLGTFRLGGAYQILVPTLGTVRFNSKYTLLVFERNVCRLSVTYVLDIVMAEEEIFAGSQYIATLTGAADSLADIEIPMSRFTARKFSGTPSSLSVIVPNGSAYAADISARPNADIIITRHRLFRSGLTIVEEIINVNFNDFRQDTGANSDSITFGGRRQTTNTTPTTVSVDLPVIRRIVNGTLGYRTIVDPAIQPGDTAFINGETYVVNNIAYTVDDANDAMDVNG